ncbi:hypothetical protein Angca_001615, partial [Angiostrongylus cantonensis]
VIYCFRYFEGGQVAVSLTENYGAFAGMILSNCEEYTQVRSTAPGDTAEVRATMDD